MKRILQISVLLIFAIAFAVPGYTFFVTAGNGKVLTNNPSTPVVISTLFRFFGLYAFFFVWNQVMLGTFRVPLTKLYGKNMLALHITTGIFTFLFTLLHPLLFYVVFLMNNSWLDAWKAVSIYFGYSSLQWYGYLGPVTFLIMMVTVSTALLRKRPFITRYWRYIHLGNYLVFIFAFLHSFKIGSEVSFPAMQKLYLFFGVTFLIGVSYKRLWPLWRKLKTPTTAATTKKVPANP